MKRFAMVVTAVLVLFCVIVKMAAAEEIEGTIRAITHCNPEEKKTEMEFFVDMGQEMIPLREAPSAKVGQRVLIEGRWATGRKEEKKKEFICQTVSSLKMKESAETSDTVGEKKYLTLLLTYSDTTSSDPDNFGTAEAEDRVFNDTNSANAFYQESSYGKIWLSGKAMGWFTMPKPTTEYDFSGGDYHKLLDDAVSTSGIDAETMKGYDGIILAFAGKKLKGGYGSIAKWNVEVGGENISMSVVWINSSDLFTTGSYYLLCHEIGHNLKWYHAASWMPPENQDCRYCEDLVNIATGDDYCEINPYGDNKTIMGWAISPVDCIRKRDAGWLEENQILRVLSDTTVELDQRELSSGGKKLIIVPCGYNEKGEEIFYDIEYVKSTLSGFSLVSLDIDAVVLRVRPGEISGDNGSINSVMFMLGDKNNYFSENNVFCDEKRGIRIELIEKYGEGADSKVQVNITFTCPEETSPSVSVSSESMAIVAGQSLIADVSIGNTMAVGCGTHTYNLKAELPDENWTAIFDSSSLDIGPYSTGTVMLSVIIPNGAQGNYEVKVKAVDKANAGMEGENIINVLVMPAPTPSPTPTQSPSPTPTPTPTPTPVLAEMFLEVSLNKETIRRGGKVKVKVLVKDADGNLVEADKISCRMTRSDGTWLYDVERNTSKTNFSFRVKNKNPLGKYKILVTVSKGGHEDAKVEKFFKVKVK